MPQQFCDGLSYWLEGERLAQAAAVTVYKHSGPATGPTLSGCSQCKENNCKSLKSHANSTAGNTITVNFDSTRLVSDKVVVQSYPRKVCP